MISWKVIVAIIIVYFIITKLRNNWLSHKWGCKLPKRVYPGGLAIGYIKRQLHEQSNGYGLDYLLKEFEQLDTHTFQVNLYGTVNIATINGENMKACLASQFNDFSLGPRIPAFKPLLGNGIFASEGHRWKISREMLRPQFIRDQISHVESLEPHFVNFVKCIRGYGDKEFDIQNLFHRLTLDASSEFLFGETVGTLIEGGDSVDDEGQTFETAFNDIQDTMTLRVMAGPLTPLLNTPRFRRNVKKIHQVTKYYVNKALNTSEEELDKKSKNGYIFLYELVKKTRDPQVLQDELISIMLAGRNTTASLLSFLMFELSQRPEVWYKLKQEVYAQFGDGHNVQFDKISFESMKKCNYLKWCINEALRMYPPVSRNLRVATKATTLPRGGGNHGESPVFLPKGAHVILSIFGCHRQKSIYGEDANEFRPERWENLKPGWNFMPFGTGPRICLGQQFALTEASYITIRMVQEFPFISGRGSWPPRKTANATMRLKEGVLVRFPGEESV